jgi:hypothetical protein
LGRLTWRRTCLWELSAAQGSQDAVALLKLIRRAEVTEAAVLTSVVAVAVGVVVAVAVAAVALAKAVTAAVATAALYAKAKANHGGNAFTAAV